MSKAYLVGAGIASLASAVYLIRDGKMSGSDIHIFEESLQTGGCLDGHGSPETGYVTRGGRMFDEEVYTCTYDLLSSIPSLTDAGKSVKNEIDEFNKKILSNSKSRLVAHGSKIDVSSMGFDNRNRLDMIEIMLQSEESLGTRRIDECFSPSFFETNFWFMWCTTFAFQPWHSAVEFKRYMHRFIHEFPRINTLSGVRRTPLNQYDAITLPVVTWLKAQGVTIHMNSEVTDLNFIFDMNSKTVERLHLMQSGQKTEVSVDSDDMVFVTIGSMVAGSSFGSMTTVPVLKTKEAGGAWSLWEKIAKDQTDFGRPSVFSDRIEESTWESFTVTFKDPRFFKLMENFTGNEAGTGGLVTFKDSNWLMSVVLAYQPHFIDQPADVTVCWGDGLFPDKLGNFVHKKMSDCTGAEILTELCSHLGFITDLPLILETSICIPCLMPFIGSQFLTRAKGDRPFVIPPGSENLAFIGQYCEIPDDTVFTVEYSVRSAQIAVYSLLNLEKEVSKLYKGSHDLSVIYNSFKTMLH